MLESISVALVHKNLRIEIGGKTTQPGLRLHEDGEAYHEDEHQNQGHAVTNGGSTGALEGCGAHKALPVAGYAHGLHWSVSVAVELVQGLQDPCRGCTWAKLSSVKR
jgi:hypothetical protein